MSRILLNKLLLHSLTNYQVLFNELRFHSHTAHHLGSLYFLGATDEQLEKTYEKMCEYLVPNENSPNEINISNWRNFIGNKHYCKSYRDFFIEQLKTNENNWHEKFFQILLDKPEQPLINGVIGGLAHPLIHIGYAVELDNQSVAIEALTMTAVCYNYLHEIIDKLKPPKNPSKSSLEIMKNIRLDDQLPIYDVPGDSIETTVQNHNDRVLFHFNQWKIDKENLEKSIEELFDLTVYIYGATHKINEIEFDFFLLHLLTSMHAIRVLYPHIKDKNIFQNILYQFFYFSIVIYISQLRPEINENLINNYEINHDWNYVIDRTLNTKLIDDAHLVKVVRTLRDAEKVYGNKNNFYLKTAIKTIDNLNMDDRWVGGTEDQRQLNVLKRS